MIRSLVAPALRWSNRAIRSLAPPENEFRILLFHDVPVGSRPSFERIVAELARTNRLLAPEQAIALMEGTPWTGGANPCLLTFDDGFASNLDVATEILARHGARAIFFVCPGLIDATGDTRQKLIATGLFGNHPDPHRAASGASLMDWDDLSRLLRAGHVIGNHTMHHRRLPRISATERATEIGAAAERLTRITGYTPWFAYTFGDIESIDAPTMMEIGRHHRICRSGVRGGNTPKVDRLALRADNLDLTEAAIWQDLVIEGALDPLYWRQRRMLDSMARTGISQE